MSQISHVLMTADPIGGIWNYSLELARALEQHGIRVSLATMGARLTPQQKSEARRLKNVEVFESSFKLEWMPEPWDEVERAGDWLQQLEAILAPDVVHLNGFSLAALDWNAPTVVVCHSCVMSWWQAVKYSALPPAWMRYEDEVREGLAHADKVVAPSQAMLKTVRFNYGGCESGQVIYNAVQPSRFRPARKEPFVLTVGRLWDEAKNLSALKSISASIRWPVYAAGETVSSYCRRADSQGDGDGEIIGLGQLSTDELADWYGRASIYALPARYEPFGLTALEAALSGCALVLGDIESLREIWADSALYVHPEDVDGLREAVSFLIRNPEEREALAQKASERAQLYDPGRMARQYVSVYESLAAARPANRAELR